MDTSLAAYLPQDRRQALARGDDLPEHTSGVALFADIAGFTPLTEALDRALGARRGVEALVQQINQVYDSLIAEVERFGGSVIGFAGDSITCWFGEDEGRRTNDQRRTTSVGDALSSFVVGRSSASTRAVACAQALQQAMHRFDAIALPGGGTAALALKVAVATGSARRLIVGDPSIQLLDALGGATVTRMATAEHLATKGEILIDESTTIALGQAVPVAEWRVDQETGERFAVLGTTDDRRLTTDDIHPRWSVVDGLSSEQLRPWLLPAVYAPHQVGLGDFLTELRPAIPLFLRFGGIDYDTDPDAGTKLDFFIRRVQQIVARYEATLLQLTIGDKGSYLYAIFGAPIAHENDAQRAARAALELRALVDKLSFLEFVQIGISRGVLRAGACGSTTRRAYALQGDEVNLAARLMRRAAPGQALISGRVQSLLAGEPGLSRVEGFALEPLEPIPLKGMPEPLPVFRLIAERPRAIRLTEPAYALPMVGRATELALIGAKLELVLAGRGQIVGIIAEAGMGKSRLIAEIIRLARWRGLRSFGGGCQSYGINAPYLVWEAIWRAFFDLDPETPVRRQIRILEGAVDDWAPEHIQALPLLGPLLGLNVPENDFTKRLEPQYRKSALEALLLDCLRAAAREAAAHSTGLLLVLEDLHWIDALSHDLLECIAQEITELPILIMLAYRPPDLVRLQAPRIESLPNFTRVELRPLADADAAQAIRAKLAQLMPERKGAATLALVARLTAKAQGNPFYIEELLNYLRDCGIDPQDTLAIASLDLPASLHSLILSRIDQLTPRQQTTLKIASVIGRRFLHAWLHSAYPLLGDPEGVRADLDELARLELTPLDRPEPELAYLFKHVVTQEVAYASLTAQARANLHEQLAAYLEQLAGDDSHRFVDLLAFHYERSDNLGKKRHYLRQAGAAAAARYANEAAVSYLTCALDLAPVDAAAERYTLLLARQEIYDLQGARAMQAHDIGALETLAEALGDKQRRAEIAAWRANYAVSTGDYAEAISAAERAVALAQAAAAPAIAAEARCWWAWALIGQGQYGAARPQAEAALDIARAAGDRRSEGQTLNELGAVAFYEKDYATARGYGEQYLRIARESGRRADEAGALVNLGEITIQQRDYVAAQSYAEQSLRIAREIGYRPGEGEALARFGDIARIVGDYDAARAYFEQALDLFRATRMRPAEGWYLGDLGLVAHHQGDDTSGERFSQQALRIGQAIGERLLEAFAQITLGHALLGLGRPTEALTAYQGALSIRRQLGLQDETAEALAGLARLALATGDLIYLLHSSAHTSKI